MPLSRSLTQPQGTIEYVVAANDTITSVAARFHTTPSELARINRRSGHFIFPGQVLYVPKSNHVSSLSADGVDKFVCSTSGGGSSSGGGGGAPPNTPNETTLKSSNVITSCSNIIDTNESPLPGHAERINQLRSIKSDINQISISSFETSSSDQVFIETEQNINSEFLSKSQHHPLHHTTSEPATVVFGNAKEIVNMSSLKPDTNQTTTLNQSINKTNLVSIDPADRECLERFLKINVKYITDGQGVVNGVLLVTPNALMFDSNVSDPLVMEHGSEMYNVTVPIELVLKTALYSDIAHMRVKHAPEAVPSVPKPSVYYASDEDTGGIVEENLKTAYAKKKSAFDTIGKVSEEKSEQSPDDVDSQKLPTSKTAEEDQKPVTGDDEEEFKDAVDDQQSITSQEKTINESKICDEDVQKNFRSNSDQEQTQESDEICSPNKKSVRNEQSTTSLLTLTAHQLNKNLHQASTEVQIDENEERDELEDDLSMFDTENNNNRQNRHLNKSIEDDPNTSIDQSLDLMTSLDDTDLGSFSTPPSSAADFQNKKPLPNLAKLTLVERHSAPLQDNHNNNSNQQLHLPHPHQNNRNQDTLLEHKPLQTAVSAEETCSDPVAMRQRLSQAGENRRGQMLKRLSNPVDAIGNFTKSGISSGINATKSGFNATKTGISKGLNATQTGITTGYQATKSGLTTGLSVTKTGFNKVLSTPKNLMDFSTGLVTAKGSKGSKSDMNLQESIDCLDENQKSRSQTLGYCNMVDTKIDALENFDKLIPRPARVTKDTPLYLCIRMGKYRKESDRRRNQRFSPTYSFGKNKYEREYWFSVPKEKAKNLYHFFKKWAPEVYGDVDDIDGCELRGLEPINTDDEFDLDDDDDDDGDDGENVDHNTNVITSKNTDKNRGSFLRISSNDKVVSTQSNNDDNNNNNNLIQSIDAQNKMDAATTNRQRFWRRSPLHFLKLVEDHFSTDGLSTEWNVSNSSEEHSFAERYNLELNTDPILPELIGSSELLNADIILNLSKHLPARAEGYAWTLIYSTSQHGFSLNTLYREMRHFDSPVLLIIEDTNGAKFGALLSHSLRISDHFYGTGETFLFSFHQQFECFPWTGENIFFIKGNIDSISIGAGEGNFGLWLDGDLYHGSSHPCKTFGNRTLSSSEDFVVKSIESWGFV